MIAAFDYHVLADVDAALNGLAFVLICAGLIAIKRGKESLHKKLMIAATCVSAAFLVSYLTYHYNVGSVKFTGEGWVRTLYLALLIPHIVLAAVQVPLILATLWFAFRDNRRRHLQFAKVTAPIWLFVSITGVIVYWMLWHL